MVEDNHAHQTGGGLGAMTGGDRGAWLGGGRGRLLTRGGLLTSSIRTGGWRGPSGSNRTNKEEGKAEEMESQGSGDRTEEEQETTSQPASQARNRLNSKRTRNVGEDSDEEPAAKHKM